MLGEQEGSLLVRHGVNLWTKKPDLTDLPAKKREKTTSSDEQRKRAELNGIYPAEQGKGSRIEAPTTNDIEKKKQLKDNQNNARRF